ncbi:flagellar protein FlgN [Novosphingobium sp. SG707]|uniref:flagellar protein FlgN n=1 Tax=Novosphingobium sp. SG707 TaxID=2586996 RepID=UPI001446E5F3|nr:flagellar protein FlgN [Novosphingobium sp. SG707]NKJ01188.1 hypothetical protein [Novosphingobium sp. SG707]
MSQALSPFDLRDTLRQMVAVLQEERQALAGLDLDGIMGSASAKSTMCDAIDMAGISAIDDECRGLLEAAKKMNEVNRQVRNLIAANVAARLEAFTGGSSVYRARVNAPAYAYAAARG